MRAIESGVQGVAAATAAHDLRGCLLSAARCAACCELRVLAHAYLLVRLADLFRLQAVVRAGQRLHAFHLRSINSTHMRRRNTSATYCAAACPPPPPASLQRVHAPRANRVTACMHCAHRLRRRTFFTLLMLAAPPSLLFSSASTSIATCSGGVCKITKPRRAGRGPLPASNASSSALGGSQRLMTLKRSNPQPSDLASARHAAATAVISAADSGSSGCCGGGGPAAATRTARGG